MLYPLLMIIDWPIYLKTYPFMIFRKCTNESTKEDSEDLGIDQFLHNVTFSSITFFVGETLCLRIL